MTDKKIELLEKLIKENKISLKEAMVLLEKEDVQYITSPMPIMTPITVPSWTPDPFTITCGGTCRTTTYPNGTTVTFTT